MTEHDDLRRRYRSALARGDYDRAREIQDEITRGNEAPARAGRIALEGGIPVERAIDDGQVNRR